MIWLLGGGLVLLLFLMLGKGFVRSNPRKLAGTLARAGGLALIGVAIVLAATGKWAAAMPVGMFGLSMLGFAGFSRFPRLPGGRSRGDGVPPPGDRPGRVSRAASAVVELELDHGAGTVRGRVRQGRHAGRDLASLTLDEVVGLWSAAERDRESRALLEVYLDRRNAGWREHLNQGSAGGQRTAARPGGMSEQEAYETLGLAQGASADAIRGAHRNLMKRVHPDMGGSAALAARINEAKERLLGNHRGP